MATTTPRDTATPSLSEKDKKNPTLSHMERNLHDIALVTLLISVVVEAHFEIPFSYFSSLKLGIT